MCRHQGAGGWHHPVHIHLSDYLVIRANRGDDEYNDWDILTQVRFFNDRRLSITCESDDQALVTKVSLLLCAMFRAAESSKAARHLGAPMAVTTSVGLHTDARLAAV
jgi:hypothetical protein